MKILQRNYLNFFKEYSLYAEYFKEYQLIFFSIIDKQSFNFEDKDLWVNCKQQIELLEQENDRLLRLVLGEIEMALFKDDADFRTKTEVREITKLGPSKEHGITKLFSDYKKCTDKKTKAHIYISIVEQIKKDR